MNYYPKTAWKDGSLVLLFLVLLQFSWRRGAEDSKVCFIKTLLEGIDTANFLICEVRPYLSSLLIKI